MHSQANSQREFDIQSLEQCFRVLHLQKQPDQLFVPSCVQFKIKNFTEVNFQNLSAKVNGVLCISFLIFTHDNNLEDFLLERLYWNPEEQNTLEKNRKKKIERTSNFLPVTFNKDITVKVPTTRTKEFQIQAFKTRVTYQKQGKNVVGWRVFHVIRKEFLIEIIKSSAASQFFAPFNFINLDLTVSLDHMAVDAFEYKERVTIDRQKEYIGAINSRIQKVYKKGLEDIEEGKPYIKRISFNNLNLEQPYKKANLSPGNRLMTIAPMLACSTLISFGKYDIVETQMEAFTYDQREAINLEEEAKRQMLFSDVAPTQLAFKPFKYAIFKIPLYRFPVVDMMTIFVPLWLLAFISMYVFYQTTEIMNRIINVAALMIAYAAIQPIVRENLPDATSLTFVDLLIYMELLVNILFLARSISIRNLFDDQTQTSDYLQTNYAYNRWEDGLFIVSFAISLFQVFAVLTLIGIYLYRRGGYKGPKIARRRFSISKNENWTLKLLMERAFARYKETLVCFDDFLAGPM